MISLRGEVLVSVRLLEMQCEAETSVIQTDDLSFDLWFSVLLSAGSVCVQLQVRYRGRDGLSMLRIITVNKEVTSNRWV